MTRKLAWESWIAVGSLIAILMYFLLDSTMPLWAIIIAGGIPLLQNIAKQLLNRNFGADVLAAMGLIVAVILKEYLAATLIVLMLASGQALEAYATKRASSVLHALASRMPSVAHRKIGEKIEEVALASLQVGDIVVVYPHESCPVDGQVIEGHGAMDESYLTGEPYRISKAPGASVLSGAINGEAVLVVRAEKLPADSRYAQIMTVMSEAEQRRPKLRRLADQLGAIFAPLSLAIAILTWIVTGDVTRFLSVLLAATPCPLLIAIPITIVSAISLAAKRGIIIKDPTVLERLPTCRTAIFDKTGTLTYGHPELSEILVKEGVSQDAILQKAAGLERYSKHPLAGAILKAAEVKNLPMLTTARVSEKPGQGLTGLVASEEIAITHRNKMGNIAELPPVAAGLECIVLVNGKYAATFRFRDKPRDDGYSFIHHLAPSHQFNRVMLVSGDRESEVKYLAEQMGITETYASQTPEQKLALVRAETEKAPTLFMGDGINDAPALAAATVGLAFGQHSNVTGEAAGAIILESSLSKTDELIHISESLRRIALQSALGGMGLSLVGMGAAAAGLISPVGSALLQEAIDVLAILNALQLTWRSKIETDMPRYKAH